MATIVFAAVGNAVGGPIGGSIGAFVGRQVDTVVLGTHRNGPRLRELEVSLSSYGQTIPRVYGRMRVPGSVIWATELQEHSELQGSKSQPAVKTYSYSANLAVALSSRPIQDIGRIWADGKLLRGAAGDLKVGGTMRIHPGREDQAPDPLIAAAEGLDRCPAFRDLAYVVFEALDLTDFGNRMPTLTFEVIADEGVRLDVLLKTVPRVETSGTLEPLSGLIVEDDLGACLAALEPALPIALDAAGETIRIHAPTGSQTALLLDEPAAAAEDDVFAPAQGISRRRDPSATQPSPVLRYLDVERDYQPSTQHAAGRGGPGQPNIVELPAAMQAPWAQALVEQMRQRRDRAREQISWRTCTLDRAVSPGTLVRLPGIAGTWQVDSWEWRESGIELELVRVASSAVAPSGTGQTAPFPAPADELPATTRLAAFELPWDGEGGAPDRPQLVAAVSATSRNWSGAALFVEGIDGQLWPVGSANRRRAVIGIAVQALAPASPLLLDRLSQITVALASADQSLSSASMTELAQGANLALIGDEIVQFGSAEPLGNGHWRLSQWLRGCRATEGAIGMHAAGEPFVLIDDHLTMLDASVVKGASQLAAIGRAEAEPVVSPIRLGGISARPLAPVHARLSLQSDGEHRFSWCRRARGGWTWRDGVDVPLAEEAERYIISLIHDAAVVRSWLVGQPTIGFPAADFAQLAALAPNGRLQVCQQGTYALSLPLHLTTLT